MKLTQQLSPEAAWELSLNNPIGIYIHIPFCESKCAYCDFYSFKANEETYENYKAVLCRHLVDSKARLCLFADTLYFGGGTPSLLGGKRIAEIVEVAKQTFLLKNSEITVEVNPTEHLFEDFKLMAAAGVNRISIGLQSSNRDELKILSRRHTAEDFSRTVGDAKRAGINNISADIMLGIPNQTNESLIKSIDFAIDAGVTHISCYMLKIEPDTEFGRTDITTLNLPDDDKTADMYLMMSDYLESKGFEHYEISNFALSSYRSKHNLKYWNQEQYLGLGPAAHSYINGKRFYFPRNLKKYMNNPEVIIDSEGGSIEEYIMLKLRLKDGVTFKELTKQFDFDVQKSLLSKCQKYQENGFMTLSEDSFCLTKQGFLVSNTIISDLLDCF